MKNSRTLKLKSKFFIYRVLIYFSFLLLPVWVAKLNVANMAVQVSMMMLYMVFMGSQWFLLGKEVDYRLKIYFRANSSIDRIIYRLLLGKLVILLYFICLSFLPESLLKHFFWGTWVVLGLFYSWPTRGKIIKETMTSNFGEFRFLDSFERTIIFVCILIIVISIPQLPDMLNIEALKLSFDPHEKFSKIFWDFMRINYFPFLKYPLINKIAWCLHFYFIGLTFMVLTFYAVTRYFVSRRVSILGVLALLSTWSYPKLLAENYHWAITSGYLLTWIWAILWATKSSTYRCGLLLGLVSFWGTLINPSYAHLMPVQVILLYYLFFKSETAWFRLQVLKYMLFGIMLTVLIYTSKLQALNWIEPMTSKAFWFYILRAIDRKAFYFLSFFGVILIFAKYMNYFLKKEVLIISNWRIDFNKLREISICLFITLFLSVFIDSTLIYGFSIFWILTFLSLLPVEWIFQSMTVMRSRRNIIYAVYILICLLDSHIEGRIKILLKVLNL